MCHEALPFKLLFIVLVDGWSPVAGSLVQSYGAADSACGRDLCPSLRANARMCAR
jgi:hypothetical protein